MVTREEPGGDSVSDESEIGSEFLMGYFSTLHPNMMARKAHSVLTVEMFITKQHKKLTHNVIDLKKKYDKVSKGQGQQQWASPKSRVSSRYRCTRI